MYKNLMNLKVKRKTLIISSEDKKCARIKAYKTTLAAV